MTIPSLAGYAMPAPDSFPACRVDWRPQPERAALLIHDMQRYFLDFYSVDSELVQRLVGNLIAVRNWCRSHNVPVIYTAQPHRQSTDERALLNDMWGPGLTAADPALQAIVDALSPDSTDVVLVKWRYSAFQRSELLELLRDQRRDQLLIGGIYAHIGCLVTAVDAFMNDIQPFLIGDAVADFSEADHRMALSYVANRCGRVIDTANLTSIAAPLSRGWLTAKLARMVDAGDGRIDPDENLIHYGLDSIQVMELAAHLKTLGISLRFEEMVRTPTINGIWALIDGVVAVK